MALKVVVPSMDSPEDLRRLCQTYSRQAIETLAELMLNCPNAAVREKAANSLLDRGMGKPKQALAIDQINPEEEMERNVLIWLARVNPDALRNAQKAIEDAKAIKGLPEGSGTTIPVKVEAGPTPELVAGPEAKRDN